MRCLNPLNTRLNVVKTRRQGGINDEEGPTASPKPPDWNSLVMGSENQIRLVGQPVTGDVFDFAPAIDQFLKFQFLSDILQRDVLDWQTRELVTISALVAISGAENQLRSHYFISLNTGLSLAQLQHFTGVLHNVYDPIRPDSAQLILNTM